MSDKIKKSKSAAAPKADPNPAWAKPWIAQLSKGFLPELLKAQYRGGPTASAGHCYAASESLYHALGGKASGFVPANVKAFGASHWFLRCPDGSALDPTWDQFPGMAPYAEAKGCGFLTREPSARARAMMEASGLAIGSLEGIHELRRAPKGAARSPKRPKA